MIIRKFGGTSVGKPQRMQQVARLTEQADQPQMVVLSALSGTTNALVSISENAPNDKAKAKKEIDALAQHYEAFTKELFAETVAQSRAEELIKPHFERIYQLCDSADFGQLATNEILAQGELMSTKLFHLLLQNQGRKAVLLSAFDFMRVDADQEPQLGFLSEKLEAIIKQYPENALFITQGYICLNHRGEIDNLQRGGSDYTASLIGAALKAEEVQIWTDIDGMHNNDPRVVKNTFPIARLSFDEAAELAYFGAKILHPLSIRPAQSHNIPVRLLNTMQPEAPGTLIQQEASEGGQIKAIAAKDGITAIKIKSSRMLLAYGFLRKVFEIFEQYRTPIDMITTSEVAVSLTIDNNQHLEAICKDLEKLGRVEVDNNQTIICIVGDFVTEQRGTAAQVFAALAEIPIRMISFGGSKHNISVLIHTQHKAQALELLNQGLFALNG